MRRTTWLLPEASSYNSLIEEISSACVITHLGEVIESVTVYDTYDRKLSLDNRLIMKGGVSFYKLSLRKGDLSCREYSDEAIYAKLASTLDNAALLPLIEEKFHGSSLGLAAESGRRLGIARTAALGDFILMSLSLSESSANPAPPLEDLMLSRGAEPVEPVPFAGFLKSKGVIYPPTVNTIQSQLNESVQIGKAVDLLALSYIERARYYEPGILDKVDTECLHQYRVNIRRVRSLFSIFKKVYPERVMKRLRKSLKNIQWETNPLRDLDVRMLEKDYYISLLPDNHNHVMDRLYEEYRKNRKDEWMRVASFLRSPSYKRTIESLKAFFSHADKAKGKNYGLAAGIEVRKAVKKSYSHICLDIDEITLRSEDELLHGLRIDFKKLRYLLDFFSILFEPENCRNYLNILKKSQNELGLYNDLSVQIDALDEEAARESWDKISEEDARNITLGLGIILGVLDKQKKEQKEIVLDTIGIQRNEAVEAMIRTLTDESEKR